MQSQQVLAHRLMMQLLCAVDAQRALTITAVWVSATEHACE